MFIFSCQFYIYEKTIHSVKKFSHTHLVVRVTASKIYKYL